MISEMSDYKDFREYIDNKKLSELLIKRNI